MLICIVSCCTRGCIANSCAAATTTAIATTTTTITTTNHHHYPLLRSNCTGTVLLERLQTPQVGKKFPIFYGTPIFITVFVTFHHLFVLSQTGRVLALPVCFSTNCFIVSPTHSFFSKWSLSLRLPHQTGVCISLAPHVCHVPCLCHYYSFDRLYSIW